ncbi:DUF5946 family protein [Bacillus sp. DNRA2]|uniref:DUF5946 family protein n=1 Tax=Bacillus sp. DNRA2 TaxID=2723053 RepID=UPI001B7D0D5F
MEIHYKTCPGCQGKFPDQNWEESDHYNALGECEKAYHDLSAYLIELLDMEFPTQHAVDAYGAQHSGKKVKNIRTAFSLIGLYLAIEHGYTGRQVQKAHMELAKRNIQWPSFNLPSSPYSYSVSDVLFAEKGTNRNEMLMKWAKDVWETWDHYHEWTREISRKYLRNM